MNKNVTATFYIKASAVYTVIVLTTLSPPAHNLLQASLHPHDVPLIKLNNLVINSQCLSYLNEFMTPFLKHFLLFLMYHFQFISLGALRRLHGSFLPNSNAGASHQDQLFPLLDLQGCYSKSGFLNSSISVSEELVGNKESQASHQTY